MPHRNSTNREQPTTALRRSPRLLPKNQTQLEDPKIPNPKSRTKRVPVSDPLSPISTQKVSSRKTRSRFPIEVSNKLKKSNIGSKNLVKSSTGSTRSANLNSGVERFSCLRRSQSLTGDENSTHVKSNQESSSDLAKSEVGVNLQRQFVGKIDKRVTRSSTRGNPAGRAAKTENGEFDETIGRVRTKFVGKEASHRVERAKADVNSGEQVKGKLEKRTTTRSYVDIERERERKERGIDEQRKVIGVKRKRNQVDKGHGIVVGWTKDQELALQRAFLVAKPTPHFWKKVAKLVPGKSAQDCFNKVHSDHLTPPQPRPRSRANRTNLPSLSISPSKLLKSAEPMIKRYNCNKRRNHLTQKTARQLQQKQYHLDQDYEVDLFSIFEPNFDLSTQPLLSTPENGKENLGFLNVCRERSSSARKKSLSRLGGHCGATLVSPPVLKPVKNKALHERYIDQLHRREAKRKAAFGRETKSILAKEGKKESHIKKIDGIKAAKNALIFYARDVINQIQDLNANAKSNLSDLDDNFDDDDGDDECED